MLPPANAVHELLCAAPGCRLDADGAVAQPEWQSCLGLNAEAAVLAFESRIHNMWPWLPKMWRICDLSISSSDYAFTTGISSHRVVNRGERRSCFVDQLRSSAPLLTMDELPR